MIEINERYQASHKVIAYMGLDTGSQLITKSRQRNSVHVRKWLKNIMMLHNINLNKLKQDFERTI